MASITKHDKAQDAQADEKVFRLEDFPVHEKLEKFMEDVKWVASEIYDFFASPIVIGTFSQVWHLPSDCICHGSATTLKSRTLNPGAP